VGQKVNRQSRALLTLLIVAVILIPYWLFRPGGPFGAAVERPPSKLIPPADPPAARGGTITGSARSEPRSFNRLMARDFQTEVYSLLTHGRLVRINRVSQEVEPWLAEKWTASDDRRTFTLTLRDGVTWSDGAPFTSADVVFTFAVIYDEKTGSGYSSIMRVGGQPLQVSAPDARTVVITYPAPFAPGIRQLDNLPIVPRHKLEAAFKEGRFAQTWTAATPPAEIVGLGPFVLSRYERGQRIVYDRNPRYWRHDERGQQLPYADRIVMDIVPDQDTELLRLNGGELDFVNQQLPAQAIASVRALADEGKLRLYEQGVATDPDHFVFNLDSQFWAGDPRGAWINRKEFRQALSHAVDREDFAETVFLGEGVPIHGPITPGNTKWFWPSIPRYEHSLEKARGLLNTLGLANRDADEWLEDAAGNEARFTVQTFAGNSVLERSAAFVRDELRKIGVAVDVATLEANTVLARMMQGQFEAVLVAFQADLDPALNKDFWTSAGSAHVWHLNQKTPATDWERKLDDLALKQASTFDEDERKRLFNEMQRLFADHLPILYFAAPKVYVAASSRLINLQPATTRPQLLWTPDTLAVRDAKPSS
jgi:peptide/nickel transport system substrate-binding protein